MALLNKIKWRIVNLARKTFLKKVQYVDKHDKGILFIVFKSRQMLNEVVISAVSIRKLNESIPICIFTDQPDFLKKEFERISITNVQIVRITPKHFRAKVDYIHQSPFTNTLYADTDIIFKCDPQIILDGLKQFDVLFCHDFARKRRYYSNKIKDYAAISEVISEVNGGIFAFRKNDNVDEFLKLWRDLFYKYFEITHGYDQPTLRIAMATTPNVRFFIMNDEFNCRPKTILHKCLSDKGEQYEERISPKILHTHFEIDVQRMSKNEMSKYIDSFDISHLIAPYGRT